MMETSFQKDIKDSFKPNILQLKKKKKKSLKGLPLAKSVTI